MNLPSSAHFLYIPAMLLLGIVIGYMLGTRAAAVARADQAEHDKRKEARKARRAHARNPES